MKSKVESWVSGRATSKAAIPQSIRSQMEDLLDAAREAMTIEEADK